MREFKQKLKMRQENASGDFCGGIGLICRDALKRLIHQAAVELFTAMTRLGKALLTKLRKISFFKR